jgi:ADP-ribose pyrophosphatase
VTEFRRVSERTVHQGHVWHVVVATFTAPDGSSFERDIVRSPGAVGVLPVDDSGSEPVVVLVRQYRAALDAWVEEVPAGMRDVAGEPLEITAQRELAEEVGLVAERIEPLTVFYPTVGMSDSVVHLFLATGLSHVGQQLHGPEEQHLEIIRLPLRDAMAMVDAGAIRDSKTVIALSAYARRIAPTATGAG